jgi:glycosyltransferase involved in cell wall biosynthesis
MKIKVTHLTSVHKRYDVRIFHKMCCSIAENPDYEVSLVVADGMGDEIKEGVFIYDVGTIFGGRILRMTKVVYRIFIRAKVLNSDIYHFHDPELIPTCLKLKRTGKKVVFDIHEDYVLQILGKNWIPVVFRKFLSIAYQNLEFYACKRFDLLIVPQISMQRKFEKCNKTVLVANFPNKISVNPSISTAFNKFRLIYSGRISEDRGIWNILDFTSELYKINKNYSLTLVGEIDDSLLKRIQSHEAWQITKYLGVLSRKDLYEVYKQNSIGLILFNNVGQYFMAYSLKLFEYLQNGMFVIIPNFGDWIALNENYQVGLNVDPNNALESANIFDQCDIEFLEARSTDNRCKVDKFFNWENEEKILYDSYISIL